MSGEDQAPRIHRGLKGVYFDQLRAQLDEDRSVQENIADGAAALDLNGSRRHVIGYLKDFLFSSHWAPTRGHFGILAMIISSVFVTLGALVLGVPLGLACAIVLAEFSPQPVKTVLKPTLGDYL